MGISDDIEQLADLVNRGILTNDQFEAAKSQVLRKYRARSGEVVQPEPSPIEPLAPRLMDPDTTATFAMQAEPTQGAATSTLSSWTLGLTLARLKDRLPTLTRQTNPRLLVFGAIVVAAVPFYLFQPNTADQRAATPSPPPLTEAQINSVRCVRNLANWIDQFELNYERVYRTFGVQSYEVRVIADLSTQYYTRSFQVGADVAASEINPQVVSVCAANPDFAARIAGFPVT